MEEGRNLHDTSVPERGGGADAAYTVHEVASGDGVATLVLSGELDMAAAPEVRARVDAAAGRRGLVIDLGQATFIDSAVLKELLRASAELARKDTRLVLAAVAPPVRRLLEITRTAELFVIAEDRHDALQQLEAGPPS